MKPSLRALVVDDEPVARELLRAMLGELTTRVEVVGECGNAREAISAIRRERPEVVFLDVQMPGGDGFEIIEAIGVDAMPAVVFVTAHERFALKAFELPAADYLLKPFDEERLQITVERLLRRLGNADESLPSRILELLRDLEVRDRHAERLAVEAEGHMILLPTSEILWLEAQGKHVGVRTMQGSFTLREGLSSVAERLDPRQFLRIHRSTVVRIDRVKEIHRWFRGGYRLVMSNGTPLVSGGSFKAAIEQTLLGRDLS